MLYLFNRAFPDDKQAIIAPKYFITVPITVILSSMKNIAHTLYQN